MTVEKTDQQKWWQIFLPDLGAWFFLYLLFGMLFLRPELLLWDGGSCRHILNGVLIRQNLAIPATNYTSALFANTECVTRSWLSDLISGSFYEMAHLAGVVFICSLVIVLGLTWSYQMGRARGLGMASGLVMLAIVMATVGMHWSARSHVYSYLPFLALYYLIFMYTGSPWRRAFFAGLVLIVWANLHGSFLIGIGMILVKMVCQGAQTLLKRQPPSHQHHRRGNHDLRGDALALAFALSGSCINPRSLSFYSHVGSYLTNPVVLQKTDEWRAFDLTAGVGAWAFLVLLGVTAWLMLKTKTVPSLEELVLLILLAVAGFASMRLIPYCALIVMPIVGPAWRVIRQRELGEEVSGAKNDHLLFKLARLERRAEDHEKSSLKIAILSLVVALIMGSVIMSVPSFQPKDFDEERLPVGAVNYMARNGINGLGFNYDNWGGYLYLKLHRPVFIDDWADFLPVSFVNDYLDILTTHGDWQPKFEHYQFGWVLTPNEAQLTQVLSHNPHWHMAYRDKLATLLVARQETPP
jgi:hypothetical protein